MFSKTISARFLTAFLSLFILLTTILNLSAVLFLRHDLVQDDRRFQQDRLLQYWAVYRTGGIDLLRNELNVEQLAYGKRFFALRISTSGNRTLLLYVPAPWEGFDLAWAFSHTPLDEGKIYRVAGPGTRSRLEIRNLHLPDGNVLQLAVSTEERDGIVVSFATGSAVLALLIAVPGLLLSVAIARRLVRPLSDLSKAIAALEPADIGKEPISIPSATDEVVALTDRFNAMGGRIQQLISGFREGLDNIAHDLQTPVTRLMQRAELALGNDDRELLRDALRGCVDEATHVHGILRSIMAISRAENALDRERMQPVDLSVLVGDLIDLYAYAQMDEQSRFTFRHPSESVTVLGNADALRQALANLLDNALKYSPMGSPVTIDLAVTDGVVHLTVRDEGEGIAPADLPHIWERTYRGDKSRSRSGSGLGLSLVKAVTEAHGGTVNVESAPGEGSLFDIALPILVSG